MSRSTDLSNILETELVDTLRDIKQTRGRLGKFSIRYMTEAIYGEAYARRVLGDDERYDVLIEDIDLDTRSTDGGLKTRIRDGENYSGRQLTKEERIQAQRELEEQEREVDQAAVRSWREGVDEMTNHKDRGGKSSQSDNSVRKLAQVLSDMSPEEREELIETLKGLE